MTWLLREPLVHFLLAGAGLFVLDLWLSEPEVPATAPRIELTAAHLTHLREGFQRQHQRQPDETELRGLITLHLREEVLYREALALGLDREDGIVRRRLAQKMEFLTADLAQSATPDDAMLAAFLAERADRYATPGEVDFRQIFFSRQKRGAQAEDAARAALAELARGVAEDTLGDGFLHGFEFAKHNSDDLTALFGGGFSRALADVPLNTWSGPLASSYGVHLVLVTARTPGQPAVLAGVRERVLRDYQEHQRVQANQSMVDQLLQRYQIVIAEPELLPAVAAPAVAAPAVASPAP